MTHKPSRKIAVLVTSRASYARIKSTLSAIKEHPSLQLVLVVGASALLEKYGSAINVIERDGFTIDGRVYMVLEGENLVTMAKTAGIGIVELATFFDNARPDIVVTVADRYETIATAIAASYLNIAVAHVQGGEVSGSIDEKVRHAVTKLSNVHFVATKKAAARVIRMGESPETVYVTGCPSVDLAAEVHTRPAIDFDPFEKYRGVGAYFDISQPYIVVLQHPVTTEYELALTQVGETLEAIYSLGVNTFWFWPNVDAGSDQLSKAIRNFREKQPLPFIHFFKNMPPEDFLRLVRNSACVVGNSSVGIRECSFLGVPVVNIGTRQVGRDRGKNVVDVPHDRDMIAKAIREQIAIRRYPSETLYGDGQAGRRIADLLSRIELPTEKRFHWPESTP